MPGPAALPLRMTPYPLYRRLGGIQGRSNGSWKSRPPPGFVFILSFSFCTWSLPVSSCGFSWFLSLLYNTNIHALGGIRINNPSKRAAAGLLLRLLGHWRKGFDPLTVQPAASRCTDWAIPAQPLLAGYKRAFRRSVLLCNIWNCKTLLAN